MLKNDHFLRSQTDGDDKNAAMDILRKELNSIYAAQELDKEQPDPEQLKLARCRVDALTRISQGCTVITDAASDTGYLQGGTLAALLGLTTESTLCRKLDSSDEDIIYNRLHPEDLVEKRMLEYAFFRYVHPLSAAEKMNFKATCRIRIKDKDERYRYIDNSTQILCPSSAGKIWLILCCYHLSADHSPATGIAPRIVDTATGRVRTFRFFDRKRRILSEREKEILRLIKCGKGSKQIADALSISVNTVSRHRQNILMKLSVGNSVEAVSAATEMGLL